MLPFDIQHRRKVIQRAVFAQIWLTFMIGFPYIGYLSNYTAMETVFWISMCLLAPLVGMMLLQQKRKVGAYVLLVADVACILWIGSVFVDIPINQNSAILLLFSLFVLFGVVWYTLYALIGYLRAIARRWHIR